METIGRRRTVIRACPRAEIGWISSRDDWELGGGTRGQVSKRKVGVVGPGFCFGLGVGVVFRYLSVESIYSSFEKHSVAYEHIKHEKNISRTAHFHKAPSLLALP